MPLVYHSEVAILRISVGKSQPGLDRKGLSPIIHQGFITQRRIVLHPFVILPTTLLTRVIKVGCVSLPGMAPFPGCLVSSGTFTLFRFFLMSFRMHSKA